MRTTLTRRTKVRFFVIMFLRRFLLWYTDCMTSEIENRFLVLIPALDAEATLPDLLPQVIEIAGREHIVVIDDGSTDDTSGVVASFGVRVLHHSENRGKGRALMTGLLHAREHGYQIAITIDADGQHLPYEMPGLIAASNDECLVVGQRSMNRTEMPTARRLSNFLTSLVISILGGVRVRDSQCGYRVLPVSLAELGPWFGSGFDWESEVLLVAAQRGLPIFQVPITTVYNQVSSSNIHPLADTLRFVRLAVRHWMLA